MLTPARTSSIHAAAIADASAFVAEFGAAFDFHADAWTGNAWERLGIDDDEAIEIYSLLLADETERLV